MFRNAKKKRTNQTAREELVRWPFNVMMLLVVGLPAFTGYPLGQWQAEIVTGIPWSHVIYWMLVSGMSRWLLGARMFANIVAVAALIALPVVFAGGTLTWLGKIAGLSGGNLDQAGIHYTRLCLTMLTVIPLALAIVTLVPFNRFEQRLVSSPGGVSLRQKKILMILRVFDHIAFSVLPGTLEILREEGLFNTGPAETASGRPGYGLRLRRALSHFVFLAVGTICAALQYIPLWAYEIGQLPAKDAEHKSGGER